MQLSETVLAAMIGAIATVSTALFQLFTALRSRNKLDVRPKKGMTFRSIVAVIALMVASGVGGYLYAGLRQQNAADDLHSMRDELNAKLQMLASTTERLAQARDTQPHAVVSTAPTESSSNSEAVLYAPACAQGSTCAEATAPHLLLCSAIPKAAQVREVGLFAKAANAETNWDQALVKFEQDIGGAKFTGAASEHLEDADHKAVCVEFVHWSNEAHLARLAIQYGAAPEAIATPSSGNTPAIAATASSGGTQGLSLVSPLVQ